MKATRYKGYTLAEIIVVVVVMGIVAAITISSTVQHMAVQNIETRFKSLYSFMSRAMDEAEVYNGPVRSWVYSRNDIKNKDGSVAKLDARQAEAFATTYITPYLNIMYVCDTQGKNRCFAGEGDTWYDSSGFRMGDMGYARSRAYAFRHKNGMSFAVNIIDNGNVFFAILAVDIDGPDKGLSIMGRDVFLFSIGGKDPTGKVQPFYPGVNDRWGKFDTDWNGTCRNSGDNTRYGTAACGTAWGCNCAYDIYRNNFKLPYRLSTIANRHRD